MRKGFWVVAWLCVAAGMGWYVFTRSRSTQVPAPAPAASANPNSAPAVTAVHAALASAPAAVAPAPASEPRPAGDGAARVVSASPAPGPAAEALPEAEPAGLAPETVLSNMRRTIRQYGDMFGGNPVGTNPEITRALNGDNPRRVIFLKPDGNRVNENGELVDPWGTPYFFHQLSSTEMEIRSAGPDRIMYTGDDLVTR